MLNNSSVDQLDINKEVNMINLLKQGDYDHSRSRSKDWRIHSQVNEDAILSVSKPKQLVKKINKIKVPTS